MTTHTKGGKKYAEAIRRFDGQNLHNPGEAIDLVKSLASARFDETVELAVRLGVDPRKADQIVRGTVAAQVSAGFLDFDVAIATPDLMRSQVGKLGRVLGPRGLMPNPKTGTVTDEVGKAVREFKGGRVEYRTDRYGNIHVPIGRASFARRDLLENLRAVLDELSRAKPAAAKGRYLRGITVSSTMGPGVKVDPNGLKSLDEELAEAS